MLMKSLLKRSTMMARYNKPMFTMASLQSRSFGAYIPKYHFEDKDFEPTVTQVSVLNTKQTDFLLT